MKWKSGAAMLFISSDEYFAVPYNCRVIFLVLPPMCRGTAEAAYALDALEIFKTTAVIVCKSGNLTDFSFGLLITRNHFREHCGSFADTGCE